MGFVTHSGAFGLIWDDGVEQILGSALWSLILTQGLVLALGFSPAVTTDYFQGKLEKKNGKYNKHRI